MGFIGKGLIKPLDASHKAAPLHGLFIPFAPRYLSCLCFYSAFLQQWTIASQYTSNKAFSPQVAFGLITSLCPPPPQPSEWEGPDLSANDKPPHPMVERSVQGEVHFSSRSTAS